MRGYGLPRQDGVEYPDIVDIQHYALKTSTGKIQEPGGDYKPYIRKATHRATARRIWKKKERALTKKEIYLYS